VTAVDPTASNAAPVNSTCWPPTSERDAHLGAYATHGPAPSGLTAAQKIRLEVTLKVTPLAALIEHGPDEMPILRWRRRAYLAEARLAHIADALRDLTDSLSNEPFEAAVRDALRWVPDELHLIPDPVACPDPGLHDETEQVDAQIKALADWIMSNVPGEPSQSEGAVDTAIRVMAKVTELKTELLETHADLEASRAREQIAQGQRDAVLAYITDLKRHMADQGRDIPQGFDAIRAIYAEHGDERNGDE
jgi:hypothetical protein